MEAGTEGRILRPGLNEKFRPAIGKRVIEQCMSEVLTGQKFNDATVAELTATLAENIRKQLMDLQLPRYKYLVDVIIGEQRGQGARIHSGCHWDLDTDSQISNYYQNDSLFCNIIVFAVFTYS